MMTHSKTLSSRLWGTALAVVVCALLASCASTPSQPEDVTYLDVPLAETKSNSQLLRNETASRVPPEIIMEVRENVDESAACEDAKDDPDGLVRFWTSGAHLTLVMDPGDVRDVVDGVAATYVDEGWLVNSGSSRTEVSKGDDEDATVYSAVLTRGASSAAITVAAVDPDAGAPWISIDVHGPCVVTEGAESDEVLKLEKTA